MSGQLWPAGSAGGAPPGRSILVAFDMTAASVQACQWAVHEFQRPGDTIHLVHVRASS